MSGKVLFTRAVASAVAEIAAAEKACPGRKLFVVGDGEDASDLLKWFPSFRVVKFGETTLPENGWIQSESTDEDLTVLYRTRPSKIPDRNLGTYQSRTKGFKLAIHDHPFCGQGEAWWAYFPFSYVDKTLLGYPHSYAVKGDCEKNAFDVKNAARLVAPAAASDIAHCYGDDIEFREVRLSDAELAEYERVKAGLFGAGTLTPRQITRALKKHVDETETMRAAMKATGKKNVLPLLDLNRLWPAYRAGARVVLLSNAKVDSHLNGRLQRHVSDVESFLAVLSRRD